MTLFAVGVNAQTYDNEAFTATWSMADGAESTCAVVPEEAAISTKWSLGSKLAFDKVGTQYEIPMTYFTRVGNDKGKNDLKDAVTADSYIDYTIVFKDGLTFAPESASFDITKIGTGDPNIFVHFIAGTTTSLGDNIEILRNDNTNIDKATLHQEFDIASKNVTPTSNATLRIYIGKLAAGKQVGIANVVIKGKVSGTASNKSVYTVVVKANPEEAGTVTASAENVTEGNSLTLTAKANRGYSFVNWTDATGAEVSTEAVYTFVPAADVDYTANFAAADFRTISVTTSDQEAGSIVMYTFSNNVLVSDGLFLDGDSVIIEARNTKGYLFKEWSDGNTDAVRSFIVDGDAELQASFEVLPEKQAIAFMPMSGNLNFTVKTNCAPTFTYCDDDDKGFSLDGAAEAFGENMQKFTYPEYDAADPDAKVDSTFYLTLNPVLEAGEVLVIRSIEFNAVRNGTDAGDWKVSIVRDGDEANTEVIAENFKPNRNNAATLSHFYFNVGSDKVAEENAEVRITIVAPGNKKSYNINKLRVQGCICDKEAVGIAEIATEKANRGVIYNLAGQRVESAQKGLYIRNGKKFVK